MRAAIFHGPGEPITIEQVPDPEPAPGDLLVRIHRCGICGSDVSMSAPGPFVLPLGKMGHEYSAEVIEVGSEVSGFAKGDRVAVLPILACGQCDGCRKGNAVFCTAGIPLNGGFGEYMAVPAPAAVRLPQTLSFADGALVEPMACGLHALRLARMNKGERVVVLGAGAMALSMVYWARRLGAASIVVLSRSSHRNDIVMAMGADAVLDFGPESSARLETVLGGPADIVAECVGKEGMLDKAIEIVRIHGTVLSLGMCMANEPVNPAACTFKEVHLIFPMAYSADEFVETARAFENYPMELETMVSDVIGLDEFPSTLEQLRAGRKCLKVQVDPTIS